ncbi:MAG: lysophospholipid acyltransferase family protein [Chloroflexota bacterium]
MAAYLIYRVASWLVPLLPRAVSYALCDFFGEAAFRVNRAGRMAARANLRHVYRAWPPNTVVREMFRSAARNYLDTFIIPSLTPVTIHDWARVEGMQHLEAALAEGRGAILAGMHLGSAALAAQVLAMHGWPMRTVVEPIQPPALFNLISGYRSARGVQIIPLNADAIGRRLIRELRANHVLGLMLDRELSGTGAPIQFFDAPAVLSLGAATLALATGAALLPSLVLRDPDGRVRGVIEAPVTIERTGDRDVDARAFTRRVVERLEYYIAQAPGQWTLFVPVWDRPLESPRC